MAPRLNYSGLVIAVIGFVLTRFTVTLSLSVPAVQFYLTGVLPLTLGLSLAAFGVALTVTDVHPSTVRITAIWCVIGTFGMTVLAAVTLLGSASGEMPAFDTMRSQAYLSNFLIGGAIGGTLTGLFAARNRHHRYQLSHQANRLEVLNRMLRHEILNAVTVIKGYSGEFPNRPSQAVSVIADYADRIEESVEEVRYLARDPRSSSLVNTAVDVHECLADSIAAVEASHPDADISYTPGTQSIKVRANERLEVVFEQLLENAVVHASQSEPSVSLSVDATPTSVRVSVTDHGDGLPDSQRALLEEGRIAEFDDASAGFGLNVVRLLVESYRGEIETHTTNGENTITVVLPRANAGGETVGLPARVSQVRPALPHLLVTLVAALLAGGAYGLVAEYQGGSIAGIGVLYGAASPIVGWITHEFHSVVFAFVFAGLLSVTPERYRTTLLAHLGIGVGWGIALWLGAAGVIAPVWLRILGIPASVPSISTSLLWPHLAWGVSLGLLTAVGYRYLVPVIDSADWLSALRRR